MGLFAVNQYFFRRLQGGTENVLVSTIGEFQSFTQICHTGREIANSDIGLFQFLKILQIFLVEFIGMLHIKDASWEIFYQFM